MSGSQNLDEIPCRIIVLTPVLTLPYATHIFAYAVHLEQERLTQTLRDTCFAQNAADTTTRAYALHTMYNVQWTSTTPKLPIWMLKKHLRMRTKKKTRRQKQPSSSSRPAADLQQTCSRPAADLQQQKQQQEVEKWKWKGDARKPHCNISNIYIYIIEVFNHTLPLTQRFGEGGMWATGGKDTGAYAELTRRNSQKYTKITWSFSCLTWRFDCSAVVFWTVCVQQFEFGMCMCVELNCSLILALLRGVLMHFSCISSELTHGLRKRFPLNKLTQPYARAGFAYAQHRYDNALSEYEQEGFSNGSHVTGNLIRVSVPFFWIRCDPSHRPPLHPGSAQPPSRACPLQWHLPRARQLRRPGPRMIKHLQPWRPWHQEADRQWLYKEVLYCQLLNNVLTNSLAI